MVCGMYQFQNPDYDMGSSKSMYRECFYVFSFYLIIVWGSKKYWVSLGS